MQAEGAELGAAAQGREQGLKLGVLEATHTHVQVLEGGCIYLQQSSQGLTDRGQGESPQTQVLSGSGTASLNTNEDDLTQAAFRPTLDSSSYDIIPISDWIKMSNYNPSSLLQQAFQSLLGDENLAISSLRSLPAELFPCLFLEAYTHRLWETLKALVQNWPFERLPLGALVQDVVPENPSIKAVMDGIDILLKQDVPPRCKLQVLDLRNTGHKFWSVWTGVSFRVDSQRRKLVAEGVSRNEDGVPCLEVCVDLYLSQKPADQTFTYLLNWIQERKGVHLSCKKVTVYSLPSKNDRFLHAMPLCGIQEVEVHCTWPFSGLHMFSQLLGKMKSLRRLSLDITVPNAVTPEEEEKRAQSVNQFASVFLHLRHLQELYLESPSFLQGHLDQVFRFLNTPLEVFSLTNCTLTERDLIHLFQSPHINHLKDLCLRGVPLTSVSEPLRALLEINAATLQHLDLGLCGLQDPQLEALLPALSSCSQLSSLSLHGNRLSMATLEKLLCCTSGLQHLCLQLFPAPLETFTPQGALHPGAFNLICTQISTILRDLGHPRSIMLSTGHCKYCAKKVFRNWEPMILPCLLCLRDYKRLYFRLTGSDM
ncbi:PRAME family member 7-like [Erinaceus europaeus]|uniref:PRAME family member 7-like n=1 Tax=Erinaceus europaeus TaxID=9365 RepID=A0ABM3YBA8_ERIEU|nr:PRAME family member 7-like [Erinaceus europaeus]